MNVKEEKTLKEIIDYVKQNKRMPTMRYLQKKLSFKSINSITEHLKCLEKEHYLLRNKEKKLILNDYSFDYEKGLKEIEIINRNNEFVHIILNKRKKYKAYKIHHNYFKNMGIFKNDILIIEENKKLYNNDIGLFIIDNKFRIMKYQYIDGYFYLEDNERIILHKINVIGKVIMIEKKL